MTTTTTSQLLDLTTLFSKRNTLITLGIGVLLMVAGTLFTDDIEFGLALGLIPFIIVVIQLFLRWWNGRKLSTMIADPARIHWTYSDLHWAAFLEQRRKALDHPDQQIWIPRNYWISLGLGGVTGAIMLVSLLSIDDIQKARVILFGIVLSVLTALAMFAVLAGKVLLERHHYRVLTKQRGEAILGERGFYFPPALVFWGRWNSRLIDAKVVNISNTYAELLMTVRVVHSTPLSSLGSFSRQQTLYFSVPIPPDNMQQATAYAQRITATIAAKQ